MKAPNLRYSFRIYNLRELHVPFPNAVTIIGNVFRPASYYNRRIDVLSQCDLLYNIAMRLHLMAQFCYVRCCCIDITAFKLYKSKP